MGQHARGHAAVVGTRAAQTAALDQGDGRAQLAGAQGRRHPSWAAADYDHIVHMFASFLSRSPPLPAAWLLSPITSRADGVGNGR